MKEWEKDAKGGIKVAVSVRVNHESVVLLLSCLYLLRGGEGGEDQRGHVRRTVDRREAEMQITCETQLSSFQASSMRTRMSKVKQRNKQLFTVEIKSDSHGKTYLLDGPAEGPPVTPTFA